MNGDAGPAVEQADRDDASLARVSPTPELLLPPEFAESHVDKFSVSFSRAVFDGWAVQPSPCCAAASVAGACNAALGLRTGTPGALRHEHIAALLHGLVADQAARRRASVERLLGGLSIEPALGALREALAAEGRSLGGRKEAGCKPKEAMARLKALCLERAPAAAPPGDAAQPPPADSPPATAEMWAALRDVFFGGSADAGEAEAEAEAEEADDADDADEALVAEPLKPSGASAAGAHKGARVALRGVLSKLSACEQLGPAQPRLATTHIGNWGITGAVRALQDRRFLGWAAADARLGELAAGARAAEALAGPRGDEGGDEGWGDGGAAENAPPSAALGAEHRGTALACSTADGAAFAPVARRACALSARTLASLRLRGQTAPRIVVSKRDGEEEKEAAWRALSAAFARPRCALLIHAKNHYALIFALREWWAMPADGGGAAGAAEPVRVRQLLSARKGQRPTAWLDWTEVHRTLSGWAGYAIIEIAELPAAAADGESC